ncbi:variable surface protein pseudo gene [Plasmodium gonderi]|uniref:Variable surface protein pseudo protein n=1 Tax=Plasmodium gonderi TaxID=77519 RepID=A0A1Y1JPJ5_PLAGO|nr:variable surface protein pseudo gene [Plasmodium gonderi]GAW84369.1 variable surface protein pseudo gene [Plasmodium gonderi]
MRRINKFTTSIKIIAFKGIFSKYFFNAFNADNTYITRNDRILAIKIFQSKYKQEVLKVNLKLFNPKYTINNGCHKISSIYKDMKLLNECVEELLLDLPEKLDKHVVKDEITNKTLERALFKDYPIIHVIPLSRRIATILYDFTEKKIHEIAVHSTYNSLVIILTHKCNSNLYGKYTELNNVAFLTIVVICLSQVLYNIGKFDFLKKYETPEMREKELAKEKKWEIKKKREQNVLKYKEIEKHGINDLDTYMKYYKQRYYSRKVLGKFDCYCEKKIFDKIEKIYNINNKNVRKRVCKKYILFGMSYLLFQLFGIIIPVLDLVKSSVIYDVYAEGYSVICKGVNKNHTHNVSKDGILYYGFGSILKTLNISKEFFYIYITFLLSFIFMVSIIYVMIKIVKYEHLKRRKVKMNFIEYFSFCKEYLFFMVCLYINAICFYLCMKYLYF